MSDPYTPRDSQAGRKTGKDKARGYVPTPMSVAVDMVRKLEGWPAKPGLLLDPGCGDGVFVEAAIRVAVERGHCPVEVSRRIFAVDIVSPFSAISARMRRLERELETEYELGVICFGADILDWDIPADIGFVAGNPPYLEAKRMSDTLKAKVKARCPIAAVGAFDLYGAFVELVSSIVVSGAEAVLIVPNRILSAKWAKGLRESILEECVVDLYDLSADKVFPSTSVYPVVVRLQRAVDGDALSVPGVRDRGEVLLPPSLLDRVPNSAWPVLPATPGLQDCVIRALSSSTTVSLDHAVDARWCVSFHRAGLRDSYVSSEKPDSEHANRFIGGVPYSGNREVGWLKIDWAGTWIDYDEERARADKNQLPPLSIFAAPKLVVCQNARRCRCAVDVVGHVLKDTFITMTLRPGVPRWWLYWTALVLSSNIFHLVYESLNAGSRKGGGFLSFLPSTLGRVPVPRLEGLSPSAIAKLYNDCSTGDDHAWARLDAIVATLYGLDAKMLDSLSSADVPPRD